ncbi:hypothetical protein WICMUC_000008 [Wickerhamomyces mucosus]|uniref:FAD/NAD(P)-binding domain-containing protein n=1 Tax=Wickerhamomyces mucosus TaxID=1378264 RepID=A0A9P8Q0L3_9ASCO|nr:hypothetical protein WICMUC_000008 [Wickerhamomyces mucosus]
MTKNFDISSVAIVGGGPGGLVTLNELLNTSIDGTSYINSTIPKDFKPKFNKITLFEQKDQIGGVWGTEIDKKDEIDNDFLQNGNGYSVDKINPKKDLPKDLNSENNFEKPLIIDKIQSIGKDWKISAVYPHLYTNVAKRFMRFSSIPHEEDPETEIKPLIKHEQVTSTLKSFSENNNLSKHIRLSTEVINLEKIGSKWEITLKKTEGSKEYWYKEQYDGVIIANGHYSVPYIPQIPGLNTTSINIVHSKSYRDADEFKDKNVVVVGTSLSGIDIIQYIKPIVKTLRVSRSSGKQEIFPWLTRAAESVENIPRIKSIEDNKVVLENGETLDDVDIILFATGYHWSYPFLQSGLIQVTKDGVESSTNSSRIKGLYQNIFTINDPSLAFVGITLTSLKFHTLEVAAIAIASAWSNVTNLPSTKEQLEWESKRLEETGDGAIFHYYPYDTVNSTWVSDVWKLGILKNRQHPLNDEDINDLTQALEKAEEVFYKFVNGELTNESF